MTAEFVPYTDAIEVKQQGEEETFDEIAATMVHIAHTIGERQRHTVRSVHAKSHGLLRAEVTVLDGLPEALRQGMFAKPATYGAVMRFSTNPGDILTDHISTPRGLAMKVIGVEGEMVPSHAGEVTQDFVMVNAKAFPSQDSRGFLKSLKTLEEHVNDSDTAKQMVSSMARAAESVLEAVGGESAMLKGFGHKATHPLGETFSTVAAVRFGEYFGKIALVPVSKNLLDLTGTTLEHSSEWNALRDSIVHFFAGEEAVWELRVQLCTNLDKMPVEDASVEWDEELSPYVTVGRVTAAQQAAYSDARRVWVDEHLSFNPWHCLEAHRPLGNVMRARFKSYQASSKLRHAAEGRRMVEPQSAGEIPV